MIKGLKDSLERLCEENKAHLGLHYVGSFNELNSCSADDLESIVKEERSKRSQSAGGGGSMSKASSLHEQEQYEGAMSKQADIHEVNKSQHEPGEGKRGDKGGGKEVGSGSSQEHETHDET